MSGAVGGVQRGCGVRSAGGLYLETGLDPNGAPLEAFLVDPPFSVDEWTGITKRGVTIVEHETTGIYYILDWIGAEHYPNPTDLLEEVRKYGLSRRVSEKLDFSRLSSQSRILCIHARAGIKGARPERPTLYHCPTSNKAHMKGGECAGAMWETLIEVKAIGKGRDVTRACPTFEYIGQRPLKKGVTYFPAIFASFPVSRLVGIQAEGVEEKLATISGQVPFPCVMVDD